MPSSTPSSSGQAADELVAALARARVAAVRRLDALSADIAEMVAASAGSNADDEHDPEGATIAFERAQLTSLVRLARHQLDEVDAAQSRLAAGRYGRCESCGAPIARERLKVRPVARTCVTCSPAGSEDRG